MSLLETLDALSIKDFRIFQREFNKLSANKLTRYFRAKFTGYSNTIYPQDNEYVKQYLEQCTFLDGTILSKMLEIEDPTNDYSVYYDKIAIMPSDHLKVWTLTGTPDNYETICPNDYVRGYHTSELESRAKLPLNKDLREAAVMLWRCYRLYIDSNPDDDRPLDEADAAEAKVMQDFNKNMQDFNKEINDEFEKLDTL